jgi:hypothetical protein
MKAKRKIGRGNKVRFPGIVAQARALGVSRIHLWYVMTGRRDSNPLMRRYRALKRAQAEAGKAANRAGHGPTGAEAV